MQKAKEFRRTKKRHNAILKRIREGQSVKEITKSMGLSDTTVYYHLARMVKLGRMQPDEMPSRTKKKHSPIDRNPTAFKSNFKTNSGKKNKTIFNYEKVQKANQEHFEYYRGITDKEANQCQHKRAI